jgi:ABC-type transport system involved in multi-copper enzyme maturation permease subunit
VSDALTMLLGPLAAPECSRASRRSWVIWVRMAPAFAAGAVAFFVLWFGWMRMQFDEFHQPFDEFRTGLSLIEGMIVIFAMIMAPAVLAGSLAGEKERGSIGLLLTTRVNSGEIVLGRLAGRLSQVAMIELAALPALLLMSLISGLGFSANLALVVVPVALAFGGGGIALGASAMSRRGRDALLLVYLIEILLLLSPLLGPMGLPWIGILSPLETLSAVTWHDNIWPPLATAGVWALMGAIGLCLASWRLRPSCLSEADGVKSRRNAKRRVWVPPMDEARPMLWKELHIEKVGTLGRAGRWIGFLMVIGLGAGSLGLGACAAWGYFSPADSAWKDWAVQQSSFWFGNSAVLINVLIQWAIGLRAAVTISSERERGTWDALLTSPLEGNEIVRGKLWGSLWALKWLVGSALLAWTITFVLDGMFWQEYVCLLLALAIVGPFMSAVGVRTSLRSATATGAMGVTIGLWLCAWVAAMVVAWAICILVLLLCVIGWLFAMSMGLVAFNRAPWFPMSFGLGMVLLICAQFIAGVILVVGETRLRFDRVAGRMIEGKAAIAIDRLLHGVPMAPVLLDPRPKAVEPELDEVEGYV